MGNDDGGLGGTPVQQALQAIHKDMQGLASFGYLGGGLPGEKTASTLPIPLTGRVREALQVLSSLPGLPYKASPVRLAQHAVFVFTDALAQVMANGGCTEAQEVLDSLRWERRVAHEHERSRRVNAFRSLLASKGEELNEEMLLGSAANVRGVLEEVKSLALGAPGNSLQVRLSHLALSHPVVKKAVDYLYERQADPSVQGWLEESLHPWVETLPSIGSSHE